MCRPEALLPGLLLALLLGCAAEHGTSPAALVDRLRGLPTLPADVIQLEVAIIERRAGDPYLDKEVWAYTDEQVAGLERKAVLEDNGFRVGQVVGMTPSELQGLLTSERACKARRYLLGQDKSKLLELGPIVSRCSFNIVEEGESTEVSLDEARFALAVVPKLTADGRTRLHFTPEARYGGSLPDFRVAPDASGYVLEIKRPCQTFPALSWDVTLAPNQYMIVGARLDQPRRLGHACFVQDNGRGLVQRILAIRTNRAAATANEEGGDSPAESYTKDRPPPLALQATLPPARGNDPKP